MQIEIIYCKLKCGGIGYADYLLRVKNRYYTILGRYCAEDLQRLLDLPILIRKRKPNGYALWLKHRFDNVLTAKEFIALWKLS